MLDKPNNFKVVLCTKQFNFFFANRDNLKNLNQISNLKI